MINTDLMPLAAALENTRHEQFACLVVEGYSATDSYRRAFDVDPDTKPGTVRLNAHKLRHSPTVADRIKNLQADVASRSVLSTADLVNDLEQMALADINELVTLEVFNCRHCHGVNHQYQFIDHAEFARAFDAAAASKGATPAPSLAGGIGFVPTRPANADCTVCIGNGVQRVRLGNTADASPGARRLFKGVELYQTGEVKRILLHDQLACRQELHKLRGLHIDRSVSVTATVAVAPASRDEAMALLAKLAPVQP